MCRLAQHTKPLRSNGKQTILRAKTVMRRKVLIGIYIDAVLVVHWAKRRQTRNNIVNRKMISPVGRIWCDDAGDYFRKGSSSCSMRISERLSVGSLCKGIWIFKTTKQARTLYIRWGIVKFNHIEYHFFVQSFGTVCSKTICIITIN